MPGSSPLVVEVDDLVDSPDVAVPVLLVLPDKHQPIIQSIIQSINHKHKLLKKFLNKVWGTKSLQTEMDPAGRNGTDPSDFRFLIIFIKWIRILINRIQILNIAFESF